MSEEQKQQTVEDKKQVLWVSVPWGLVDKETNELQVTGNVHDRYLNLVLAKQLQEKELKLVELENRVKELTPDTSVTDV